MRGRGRGQARANAQQHFPEGLLGYTLGLQKGVRFRSCLSHVVRPWVWYIMSLGMVRWVESSEKWPRGKQPPKARTLAVGMEGEGLGVW